MANHIQLLRRVGACENKQAQPDWQGPDIPPCSEPASYLCETCGRMLCGGHAGGHWHPASDSGAIASHFQEEAAQAAQREEAAQANASVIQHQLAGAQADCETLAKIRALLA